MHRKGMKTAAIALLLGGALLTWGGQTEPAKAGSEASVDTAIAGICVPLDKYYEKKENARDELSEYLAAQKGDEEVKPGGSVQVGEGYRRIKQLSLENLLLRAKSDTYDQLNRLIDRLAGRVEMPTEAPTEAPTKEPSPYENIAVTEITIVDSFVNVRTAPSTVDGEIVGRIYNHCAATILDRVQGENGLWYYM